MLLYIFGYSYQVGLCPFFFNSDFFFQRGPSVGVQVTSSSGLSATTNSNTTANTTTNAAQCQSTSSTSLASGHHQTVGNHSQAIPDEAIVQLIRGISNNLTQAASGQPNVGTIWDIFSSIGDELDIEQFEGVYVSFFSIQKYIYKLFHKSLKYIELYIFCIYLYFKKKKM